MLRILVCCVLFCWGYGCSPPAAAAIDMHTDRPVRLWQDAAIFRPVVSMMASAEARVWVEMYEFGRRDLARELLARSRAGVDVRVIVDPSVAVSRALGEALRESGLSVRFYPVDDARHQIDHVKLLLTERDALVGGMNWGQHSSANHDYALELSAAADLKRLGSIFEQDWSIAGGVPAPLPAASAGAVFQTAPNQEIRQQLEAGISAARETIQAEIFVLTDAEVVSRLVEASRRGVRVRVLMDPNQVVNLAGFAALEAAHVGVRWYPIPSGAKLHAKAGLFDSLLVLGSANWSLSGLSVNHELDVVTQDAIAAATFRARFDADWSSAAGFSCCGGLN